MRLLWVLLLVAGGCASSSSIVCSDGTVCPAESICGTGPVRCISQQQLQACAGKVDGDACVASGTAGQCVAGTCEARFCGDGIKSAGEQCDGSDLGGESCGSLHYYSETTGLACNSDCTFDRTGCSGSCGDGQINGGELCDGDQLGTADCTSAGFYEAPGLACSAYCTWEVKDCKGKCGDGIKNGQELCDGSPPTETCVDLGADAGLVGCSKACGYSFSQCAHFDFRYEPTATIPCSVAAASSGTDAWSASENNVWHFDGTSWAQTAMPVNEGYRAVATASATSAWLVGAAGTLYHWNGTAWTQDATAPASLFDVAAVSDTNAYVMSDARVYHLMGTAWTALPAPVSISRLQAISATSDTNVWLVDTTGATARWDGTQWLEDVVDPGTVEIVDVLAVGTTEAWAVGRDTSTDETLIAHNVGGTWRGLRLPHGPARSIAATGPDDIWVAAGGLLHFDGRSWLSSDASGACLTLLGHGVGYLVEGAVYRLSGQLWSSRDLDPPGQTPWRTWSAPTGELFVSMISPGGEVGRHDGVTWNLGEFATNSLIRAIWGTSATNVWAIGSSGKPAHWDGSTWTVSTVANTNLMFAMWGSGANDIWAGGEAGRILHWNGSGWGTQDLPVSERVVQLTGSGTSDVWALTYGGTLYRWNGTAWSNVALPNGFASAEVIYSVGANQLMAVRALTRQTEIWNGTAWSAGPTFPVGSMSASTAQTIGGTNASDIWVVDGNNTLFHLDGGAWAPVRMPGVSVGAVVRDISVHSNRVDLVYSTGEVRTLSVMRPWVCATSEAGACGDFVDNDCDGVADAADPDC